MNKIAWVRTIAGVATSFAVIGLMIAIQMRVDADPGEESMTPGDRHRPANLPGEPLPISSSWRGHHARLIAKAVGCV